ncbi:helix-turn-helix transcriptional regulator [Bradyrhizobium guangdongense]|uniref:Helix-turn-helix transcriptional regulator n=1 Tax=Bradyrhizobium guangdongense TaxID=1325090 RepID=A0A410V400_9BRAD|nr:helix-turn-helix transcriptional regulator [Bradyrhizobium guangdongense]QAU38360.1 hypothetical protein X265_12250 [Bradyrhizobium guangdongense]QOZ59415.1 hypothetical protein XH86_12250 [Bradyrhizobium guangdongense]GGI32898.1 helix-turn-helix transcriptional regulator [Bradyrhizobium guangdongense]
MPIEPLSETILTIYESALASEPWFGALHRLAAISGSSGCRIVIDNDEERLVFSVEAGCEHRISSYPSRAEPVSSREVEFITPGEPVAQSQVAPHITIGSAEPWRDQDIFDTLMVVMPTGESSRAILEAVRTDERYTDGDLARMRIIAPHIARAVRMFRSINAKRLASEMFEASLEALSTGVYFIRADGGVAYLNRVARDQVRAGKVLRLKEGRLVATDQRGQDLLTAELREIERDFKPVRRPGRAIALSDGAGSGFIAHVAALSVGARAARHFTAMAAVFVQDPVKAVSPANAAFARLYGLTEGELRVLNALLPGLSLSEAAALMGISEATVKTHLHRIFNKTKTSRQAELIHLLMTSTPPTTLAQ